MRVYPCVHGSLPMPPPKGQSGTERGAEQGSRAEQSCEISSAQTPHRSAPANPAKETVGRVSAGIYKNII